MPSGPVILRGILWTTLTCICVYRLGWTVVLGREIKMTKREVKKLNLGFNIGDEVIINQDLIYYSYSQFIKKHPKYAPYWQYKRFVEPTGFPLTIIGVHNHVLDEIYDKNEYCIAVQDKFNRIYLVGGSGVRKIKLESNEVIDKLECIYCDGGVALTTGKTNDSGIGIRYPGILNAYGYDVHGFGNNGIEVKIDYCPMCGRSLKHLHRQ